MLEEAQEEGNNLPQHLAEITAEVVCAYVANNTLPASELPALVTDIHSTLTGLVGGSGSAGGEADKEKQKPAVPIKKSLKPEILTCLECGLEFKSLKKHLRASHDMSPEEYRMKWGLPADYPMVAPAYAERRSDLAKKLGLGRKA
ncbi:MAG: MucR family transcriptional regulator [Hyphomicrobiales bacterium]